MNITLTQKQEAFLKAYFDTDNIEPFVLKQIDYWINRLAPSVVPARDLVAEATADLIQKKIEKNRGIIKDN